MKVTFVSGDQGFAGKLSSLHSEDKVELQTYAPFGFDAIGLKHVPDIILFEVSDDRPEQGLSIIQALRGRESFRNVPIVVISNKPTRQSIQLMHQAGVRDIVSKSIEPGALIERLRRHFHKQTPSEIHPELSPVGAHWHDQSEAAFKKRVRVESKARLEMLPSLPMIVSEILKLAADNKSTAADFEEKIRQDQALAARILRMANAGFFAQKTTIKSLHDATVVLGIRTLKSLVIASSTSHFFDKPAEGYGYDVGGLWKHSLSCALGSQFLGKMLQLDNHEIDELFVQGLLHDVGKLLLNPFVSEKSQDFRHAIVGQGLSPLDAETAILGTNHCHIGLEIAEHWHLPSEVRHTIEFHQNPSSKSDFPLHTKIIHIANYLCHLHKVGTMPETFIPSVLDPKIEEEFELTPESIEQLSQDWKTHLDEANKLFAGVGK